MFIYTMTNFLNNGLDKLYPYHTLSVINSLSKGVRIRELTLAEIYIYI